MADDAPLASLSLTHVYYVSGGPFTETVLHSHNGAVPWSHVVSLFYLLPSTTSSHKNRSI